MAPEPAEPDHIVVSMRLSTDGLSVGIARRENGIETFDMQTVESAVNACAIAFSVLHLDGEELITALPVGSGGGVPGGALFGVISPE